MIYICKICGNTSENLYKKMKICCYDDFNNLLFISKKKYKALIKIQLFIKNYNHSKYFCKNK